MRQTLSILVALTLLGCDEDGAAVDDAADNDEPVMNEDSGEDLSYSDDALVIDFGIGADESWFAVNDTVMGGVSSGEVTYTETSLVFEGAVSTDSNGGFTSVQSPDEGFDLSMYDRVLVRLKSEGQPFSMILANNPMWYQDRFKQDITVSGTDWQTLVLPLDEFELFAFGMGYPAATGVMMTPEDAEEIFHIELMSELFVDGEFRLEVDWVAFD